MVVSLEFPLANEKWRVVYKMAELLPSTSKKCSFLRQQISFLALNNLCHGTSILDRWEFSVSKLKALLDEIVALKSEVLLSLAGKYIDLCTDQNTKDEIYSFKKFYDFNFCKVKDLQSKLSSEITGPTSIKIKREKGEPSFSVSSEIKKEILRPGKCVEKSQSGDTTFKDGDQYNNWSSESNHEQKELTHLTVQSLPSTFIKKEIDVDYDLTPQPNELAVPNESDFSDTNQSQEVPPLLVSDYSRIGNVKIETDFSIEDPCFLKDEPIDVETPECALFSLSGNVGNDLQIKIASVQSCVQSFSEEDTSPSKKSLPESKLTSLRENILKTPSPVRKNSSESSSVVDDIDWDHEIKSEKASPPTEGCLSDVDWDQEIRSDEQSHDSNKHSSDIDWDKEILSDEHSPATDEDWDSELRSLVTPKKIANCRTNSEENLHPCESQDKNISLDHTNSVDEGLGTTKILPRETTPSQVKSTDESNPKLGVPIKKNIFWDNSDRTAEADSGIAKEHESEDHILDRNNNNNCESNKRKSVSPPICPKVKKIAFQNDVVKLPSSYSSSTKKHLATEPISSSNYIDIDSDIQILYSDPRKYCDKDCIVVYEPEDLIVLD